MVDFFTAFLTPYIILLLANRRFAQMRQEILDQWTELKTIIESLEVDVLKNANGNKSAGVRVRKGLRLLKNRSSTLVKSSLQSRDE